MSDLREVLIELTDEHPGYADLRMVDIENIIADGRIGVLPTRSVLAGTFNVHKRSLLLGKAIVAGYAREDPSEQSNWLTSLKDDQLGDFTPSNKPMEQPLPESGGQEVEDKLNSTKSDSEEVDTIDLRKVLEEIRFGIGLPKIERLTNVEINAIIADGRLGILPTRSEISQHTTNPSVNWLIQQGYAREDSQKEPMTTPDVCPDCNGNGVIPEMHMLGPYGPAEETHACFTCSKAPDQDSAAVDATAAELRKRLPMMNAYQFTTVAQIVRDYLREHPEHLGIPMMTASEADNCVIVKRPVVIPDDPEPPVGLIDLIIPIVQQLDGLQCEVSEVKKQVLGLIETWKGGTNE